MALYSDRHSVFVPSLRSAEPAKAEGATQFARAMLQLGIRQIFASSPQAKGRVERACGTLQDRLVSELRLEGARSIAGANYLLSRFIERFNGKFAVAPVQPGNAFRPLDPDLNLESVLCFKHSRRVARDNTVKYDSQLIQLLPSLERPSYAGARVEVIEQTDGRLQIACQDKIVPAQLAPPRPGLMRLGGRGDRSLGALQRQLGKVAQLTAATPQRKKRTPRSAAATLARRRKPTPRQIACWKAVQLAKSKGLSLRAIARELGIARVTVAKYAGSAQPPINRFGEKDAEDAKAAAGAIRKRESHAPVY